MPRVLGEPLAQAVFDLLGEIVGAVVGLEAGDELPAAVLNQRSKKPFSAVPLLVDLVRFGIVDRDLGCARVAEHVNVGQRRAVVALGDGAQDLVGRAGRIGLAAGLALELGAAGASQRALKIATTRSQSAASGICFWKVSWAE